jgi:hypothetical protein
MRTALQELKDKFMEAGTLADWMDDAFDEAIQKEKQQIIDAANNILDAKTNPKGIGGQLLQAKYYDGEDYYRKTFNK